MRAKMEICVDTLESARNAINGGASRLEVCSALSEGGLTASPGFFKVLRGISKIPLFAMIRARAGDFVYSREEMDAMLHDLALLKDLAADGFVFGALTKAGDVHVEFGREIVKAAHPRPVTFHRAFDEANDPVESLRIIGEIGFRRILTSGQRNSVEDGLDLVKKLIDTARDDVIVMPGAGITKDNIVRIKRATEAKEFHASAKRKRIRNDSSGKAVIGDPNCYVTDENLVRYMVEALKNT